MFNALRRFDWVLPLLSYDTSENLFNGLQKAIIEPAIARAQTLRAWKAGTPQRRDIYDYI
jgi:hypothetical protein